MQDCGCIEGKRIPVCYGRSDGGVNGNITYDSDSINEKKDYMSMIKEFMQLQYDSNNLSGYLSYKELYDYINDRTER